MTTLYQYADHGKHGHSSSGPMLHLLRASWLTAVLAVGACGGGASKSPDAPTSGDDARPDVIIDGGQPDGPADAADAGSPFVCDPVHKTGCRPGEKCDIAASGNFACVPDGTLGEFRVCDAIRPNACVAGFSCRDTNHEDSRCSRLCDVAENQCRADETCSSVRMTTDGHQYRMCFTKQVCNPILDDCPRAGEHCTYAAIGGFCFVPGTVSDGDSCRVPTDCKQGSACLKVGPGEVFKCFKLCDPAGGAPACPASVTCTEFATVGPQPVGACGFR